MKNTFDITLVFVTIILCLINHTHFYGLGIGTILTALFIGRIINIYEKRYSYLLKVAIGYYDAKLLGFSHILK